MKTRWTPGRYWLAAAEYLTYVGILTAGYDCGRLLFAPQRVISVLGEELTPRFLSEARTVGGVGFLVLIGLAVTVAVSKRPEQKRGAIGAVFALGVALLLSFTPVSEVTDRVIAGSVFGPGFILTAAVGPAYVIAQAVEPILTEHIRQKEAIAADAAAQQRWRPIVEDWYALWYASLTPRQQRRVLRARAQSDNNRTQ